jgi:hypothetical protein
LSPCWPLYLKLIAIFHRDIGVLIFGVMRFTHPELLANWPKPNYVNPETRGPALYYINSTFFGLATIAIAIRLYGRVFVRRWFGLDDTLVILAWVRSFTDMILFKADMYSFSLLET